MKVICDSAFCFLLCAECEASLPHEHFNCIPCPFQPSAQCKCIELKRIISLN